MKLKFKKQQYQEDATQAVIECFTGQPKGSQINLIGKRTKKRDITNWNESDEEDIIYFGNKEIELSDNEIRSNIRKVQKENHLDYTDDQGILNYSIEMETGTGKTYTYIKTMYELNKVYGWSKFIVIVPSVAIREGVLKSFQVTEEHFKGIYEKNIIYSIYDSSDSSNINNIKDFAEESSIQVIIMNYQAFNFNPNAKSVAKRRIYEVIDKLETRKPIDVLKATRPILIIDEPQKMGKTEKYLKIFNPLFILRYSATHKKDHIYNMIYRLDAVDAYNQRLVKKINVKGIEILHDKSESAYLYLERVEITKKAPIAKMEIEVKSTNGTKRMMKTLKKGDDLYKLSDKLAEYKGYVVSEINAQNANFDIVYFTNGESIKTGQVAGSLNKNFLPRIQIRETIKAHFEKEKEYFRKGIKVLSLFFIDEVKKYKDYNRKDNKGEYARIFEEEYSHIYNEVYNNADNEYKKYLESLKNKKVHSGYFSIDKKASKGRTYEDSIFIDSEIDDKSNKISSDEDAYDLIMRDKEKLLSFDQPVRFIFSHSALREGWDNPNIFQICTLKKNNSEISKRQEIGRGLRICVNQNGDRMDESVLEENFFDINTLTVIASESYESFAKALQKEIAEDLSRKIHEKLSQDLFIGTRLRNNNNPEDILIIDEDVFSEILFDCRDNNYIDKHKNITQEFKEDIENNSIKIPEIIEGYEKDYINLINKLFSNRDFPVENENKNNLPSIIETNENFEKAEFQNLWKQINIKAIYEVNFDSEELIKNSIKALNEKLKISKMRVRITTGGQNDVITASGLREETSMHETTRETEIYDNYAKVFTKYDLIGDISQDTGLTRRTTINILKNIDSKVFEQYKDNSEEFIRKACRLINEEKALTIIDGIKYKTIDEVYDDDIFTLKNVKGRLGDNVIEVKRNIYDYLITDSTNEKNFANCLETGEVEVYAKLPKDFKIPTPVGNYNPDWIVIFNNKKFKHKYFIVETKGSPNRSELRAIENAKIECAKKLFAKICNEDILYVTVNSYEELIDIATSD